VGSDTGNVPMGAAQPRPSALTTVEDGKLEAELKARAERFAHIASAKKVCLGLGSMIAWVCFQVPVMSVKRNCLLSNHRNPPRASVTHLEGVAIMQGERTLLGMTVAAKPARKIVQLDSAPISNSSQWSKRRLGACDDVIDTKVSNLLRTTLPKKWLSSRSFMPNMQGSALLLF
jgi:hypothetical protein